MMFWPPKAPAEVVAHTFEFALDTGVTITAKNVVAEGVTKDSDTLADPGDGADRAVEVVLSGGTEGTVARVTCTVTTSTPVRTLEAVAVLPIGGGPLTLDQAKAELGVEHAVDDDKIARHLAAAVAHVEGVTGKCLTAKVVHQVARAFPRSAKGLRLHYGPVREIVAVEYDDSNGLATALADYRLVDGLDGYLLPEAGGSFPSTYAAPNAVRVDYLAGYEPGEAPPELEQAVRILLQLFYDNPAAPIPPALDALIGRHCAPGLA